MKYSENKFFGQFGSTQRGLIAATIFCLFTILLVISGDASAAERKDTDRLKSLIGAKDALLVADSEGKTIVAKNDRQKRVPASILKILTSLGALHYLGADFRFKTEFFMDAKSNLTIKGYGDPLLISEVVDDISRSLAARIGAATVINDIIVDDSYFTQPLTIPGISSSSQPYDAPNGALCVNFNTVSFKRTSSGYASAEDQTPLLPFAENKIKALNAKSGRIVFSHAENDITIYAGLLFRYFLNRNGIRSRGGVKTGRVEFSDDKLIYRYVSRFRLSQIIAKLLEFSNNFTTNQLLIACGIKKYGPPGNLANGIAALKEFAASSLQIHDLTIVEGSGISRENQVSARQMMRVLNRFESHRDLLRQEGRDYYKTGTLYGINTRAGYIDSRFGGFYRYVVMINSPGKSTRPVMRKLLQALK